ncbi:MAG: hypothetical protein J5852_01130 [Clostridia bacterium]|nr:hypothetical protein [Clostridia bacterium]
MFRFKKNNLKGQKKVIKVMTSALLCVMMLLSMLVFLNKSGFRISAEEAPAQTYNIHTAQDFINYSRAYASGDRNRNDVLNISINEGSVVTDDGFVSLGTSSAPFSGTIKVPSAGVDVFHLFDCPLFDYVSTDFRITGAGAIKIMRERVNEDPDEGVLTSGSLFANHVVAGTNSASWNIVLLPYDGEGNESSSYKGVIGDIAANANVTVNFTNTSAIPVSSSDNVGLICGTLNAGATLAVTTAGSGADLSVTSTGGHAGGLVGEMKSGSILKFNSDNNSKVTAVTSSAGYAGGVVGVANNITVQYAAGITDYTVSGSVTGSTGAGGIFGSYTNVTNPFTFDMLDTFEITSGMTVSSTTNTGGVFGMLENNAASFTFDGNSASESITVLLSGGKYRGGICGAYKTNALANTFEMYDTATNITAETAGTSGVYSAGLIGTLTSSPAYVNIHDVSCTSSSNAPDGGLVGTAGSGGSFIDVTGNVTVSGQFDAGLVADIQQGVLRLSGVYNFGSFSQHSAASGYLVKERGRALVYALGDGKGTVGNWTFKRNDSASIDDIHSWGQVIRMDGTKLTESNLVTVDMSAHTVTVAAAVPTMANITDFAKTALNIKLNTGAGVGALQFTSGSANLSSTLLAGTLSITNDIALTGTGLTGLARDNGGNADFSGTFEGNNHTITFATGENYGLKGNGTALDANSRQGNIFQHAYNGLFAETSGATVQNLTLSGEFKTQQTDENMKLGGVSAFAKNALTIDNVTTDFSVRINPTNDKNAFFGGAVGIAAGTGVNVSIENSDIALNITDISTTDGTQSIYIGGAIGFLNADSNAAYPSTTNITSTQAVNFESSDLSLTLNKTGSANRVSVFGAAIAGVTNCIYGKDNRQITFDDVDVDITVTGAKSRDKRLGAILGTDWYSADVTIDDVRIDSDITATGTAGDFGGLVRTATGRWDVKKITLNTANFTLPSAAGSTFGFIANKTTVKDSTNTSANGALYLDVDNTGTNYDIAALSFTGNSPTFTVFDEIVADSRYPGNDIVSNGNSVISITTSGNVINTNNSYNTYLNKTTYGQLAAAKINPNTRYYYNMNYARANTATAKYNFFVWSAKTYAHTSLSDWFTSSNTFSGDLDMTGISYYPVDLKSSVTFNNATVKLDNVLMEDNVKYAYSGEAGTRTTRSNTNQHYLMHTAIFRNDPGSNITISGSGAGLTLQGNVPKLSDSFCGFLIAGMLGNSDTKNAKLTASKIVFDGAHIVTNTGADLTSNAYAPLLINKVGKNFSLTINAAEQSTTAYSAYNAGGKYAASSLIGDVGSSTARAIYLTFSNLKFDGRSSATSIGNMDTTYGTGKSIFSRATILNSFLYAGESTGSYTYGIDDDWSNSTTAVHNVTYGEEVTTSVEFSNRQKKYYGSTYYTHPTTYQAASEYDFSTGFLPYVYTAYNLAEYKHELAVNVTFNSEIEGCGKYDDPFIIDDDDKLPIISRMIHKENVGNTVVIHLPSDLTSYNHTATGYTKYTYNFGTSNFTSTDGGANMTNDNVRQYLAGAYYVITKDITLPGDYIGLGTTDNDSNKQYAFRGVIIGRNITITNESPDPLIHTSMGSVVKDITIDVDVDRGGSNVIELSSPTGSTAYSFIGGLQSYGAVMGQIMGGDNIIDNIDVTFTDAVFNITTTYYDRLTPVGGYVGTLFGGGLIFRNMTSSNTGLTAATFDKVSNSGYLYVNPIIGRVINGYAFHETGAYAVTSTSIPNGNKNYTIPDLSLSAGKLNVSGTSPYTITVPDGQAMYILGAIVNSGAGSAAYNETTEQAYQALSGFWQAYRAYTTTRAGSGYSTVGTSSGDDYTTATGDTYSSGLTKVPYIVSAYTNKTGSVYLARCITTATGNTVKITGDCNVAAGFRGIGSIYLDSTYLRLSVLKCGGYNGNTSTARRVTLNMRFVEYNHNSVTNCMATAGTAGFGMFNILQMNGASSSNSINNLIMSGSVYYDVLQVASGLKSEYKFKQSDDGVYFENVLSVGSVIGYAKATAYYLKKVQIDGLQVEGARYTGGLIGFTGDTNTSTCTLDSCGNGSSGDGLSVRSGVAAGGFIGYVLGVVAVNTTTAGVPMTVLVDKIEVKCLNTTDGVTEQTTANNNKESLKWLVNTWTFAAGGIVGLIQPRTMNKTSVTNYTLTGTSSSAKHVFSASTDSAQLTHAGGMFGIVKNRNVTFTNANIEDMNIASAYSGAIVGSGFSDKNDSQKMTFIFNNVTVDGKKNVASKSTIEGYIAAGGYVGNLQEAGNGGGLITVDNSIIKNYNISSTSTTYVGKQTAGGLLGYSEPKSSYNVNVKIQNFSIKDCDISNSANAVDKNDTNGTGGLIGSMLKTYVLGYNIHISGTSITATNPYLRTTTIVGNNRDGGSSGKSYVRLVGVSAQLTGDTTAATKSRNVGNSGTGTSFSEKYGKYSVSSTAYDGYIVFADFGGTETNTAFSGIDDTTVNTDDYTNVAAADPYVTANPVITTGGITLTSDGVGDSVATLPIQSILSDTATGRYAYAASYYYSGTSGVKNYAAFSAYTGKLAMYRSEVPTYLGTNFPVLILDDTTRENSQKMINSYLRLLTNTRYNYATDTTDVYTVKIYNVAYDEHFSAKATGASLKKDDGQFYMRNSQFDSGKNQFSLIDVRFLDPSDNTKVAYHLYVPVFVKKVLSFSFDIALLSGTSYLDSLYTSRYGQALIENVGTPVTLYFKYTYSRTSAEWAQAINDGEDVHRNYQKSLMFYKANTNDVLEQFPGDTILTLVDPSDHDKPYYAKLSDAFTGGNTLNLSAFKDTMAADGLGGYTFSGSNFAPQTLDSFMTLSAASAADGTMIPCTEEYATVMVGSQGYRLATDDELANDGITKYKISVSAVNSEPYYLSIYTESNAINDELFHYFLITSPTSFNDASHPSKITDTGAHTMVHLVMGKIFYHSDLSIQTNSGTGSPMMAPSNNQLLIDLAAEFGLSDDLGNDIKPDIQNLISATTVYQSFIVYLNRKENDDIRKEILGNPTAAGSYGVDYTIDQSVTGATAYSAGTINLSQNLTEFVTGDLSSYFASGDHFEIVSSVTLTYSSDAIPTQFPGRADIPPSDTNGVTVTGSSNIAFQQNATTYTKNSIDGVDSLSRSYYSESDPGVATLDLNPIGDRVGDFTPLGINALNNDDATVADFDLIADLNIAPIADRLAGYTDALVSLQLTKKQSDGTYSSALDISEYLTVDFEGLSAVSRDATSYYKTIARASLSDNGAAISVPTIHCHVITGSDLETEGFDYSNYKITVTMVLLNSGNRIAVSQASNYVVYTNCKIIPDFVS